MGFSQSWREGESESATTEDLEEAATEATNVTMDPPISANVLIRNLAAELTNSSIYIKDLPPPRNQPEINITTSITLHHIESISAQSSVSQPVPSSDNTM